MKCHIWTMETALMRTLKPVDFQQIDLEIMGQIGKGARRAQMDKLRDLAEIYRVYASRTALMVRELHDEEQYL